MKDIYIGFVSVDLSSSNFLIQAYSFYAVANLCLITLDCFRVLTEVYLA